MNEEHFEDMEYEEYDDYDDGELEEEKVYRRSKSSHSYDSSSSYLPLIYLSGIALVIIAFMLYVVNKELSSRNSQVEEPKIEQVISATSSSSEEETTIESSSNTSEVESNEKIVLTGSGRKGNLTINQASDYVTAQFILNDDSQEAWFSMTNTEVGSSGVDLSETMAGYEVYVEPVSDSSVIKLTNIKNLVVYVDGELIDLSEFDQEKEVTIEVKFNRTSDTNDSSEDNDNYNNEDNEDDNSNYSYDDYYGGNGRQNNYYGD